VKPPDALSRAASLVNGQPDPLQNASEISSAIEPQVAEVLLRAMAQNREQRFKSAAEMRKALNGTDQATTATSRGEAATVLFPPQAPTVANSTQLTAQKTAAKQPTNIAGETTVIRDQGAASRKRVSPSVIAATALVVLCLGFGAFYALQRRSNSTPITQVTISPPATVQPTATPSPQIPETNAIAEKAAAEEAKKAAAAEKAATRTEKTARTAEKKSASSAKKESKDAATDEGHNKVVVPEEPDIPDPDVPTPPRGRPKVTRAGGVTIRNFPDGTQLITTPDGNRVLVTPDGKRRIFRRGEKVDRRRLP
jgi:eukaryotic-like serine/threonine-protein kinase